MNKKHYNVGIDLIRIFAMLAVISAHLTLYLPKTERIALNSKTAFFILKWWGIFEARASRRASDLVQ